MLKCIRSGEQVRLREDKAGSSRSSLASRDYSASGGFSSRAAEVNPKFDDSNIEEAESSLRESGYLNYEEARALLGRLEYQRGNIEAALHVFEGIDTASVTSKIKFSLYRRCEQNRHHVDSDTGPPAPPPPMSMHAISLLLEAVFLKSKSLLGLGRSHESAESCKLILDTIESALPEGLPDDISADCKLQDIINKAVELLPELFKLSGDQEQAVLCYRRALLYKWNLEMDTRSRIEKEFAVFLLYSGVEASPLTLRSQMKGSYIPRNNIEEAVLLLLTLLRKYDQRKIMWDPFILDHLSFALSVSGQLNTLAHEVEGLPPGIIERKERYCTLGLCYHGEGENTVALNLLRNSLNNREDTNCIMELLLASNICAEEMMCVEEGIMYAQKAVIKSSGKCGQIVSVGNCIKGLLLSTQSKMVPSESGRLQKQSEALEALEAAERLIGDKDPRILFHLSLENAQLRKLDIALYYAKQVLKLEAGSSVKSYIHLARILSAQKRFSDAEGVINAALDQTGKWDQGELLRTKAKLEIAQGCLKKAIATYTQLLALLQIRSKNSHASKNLPMRQKDHDGLLEMEAWHDLANIYTSLSQWRDAEICLLKSKAINPHSPSRLHSTGLLYQAKGKHQEALRAFRSALGIEPSHVLSLISTACSLKQLGCKSTPIIRSFLTDALRIDRTNHTAWYNLGLLYEAHSSASTQEVVECFEAAAFLEESAPVEPFR